MHDINNTEVRLSNKLPTGPARHEQDQYFAYTGFPSTGDFLNHTHYTTALNAPTLPMIFNKINIENRSQEQNVVNISVPVTLHSLQIHQNSIFLHTEYICNIAHNTYRKSLNCQYQHMHNFNVTGSNLFKII